MARTKTIIKQELNGFVEDVYNIILEVTDDENAAMGAARDVGDSMGTFTFDVIDDILKFLEEEIESKSKGLYDKEGLIRFYRSISKRWR